MEPSKRGGGGQTGEGSRLAKARGCAQPVEGFSSTGAKDTKKLATEKRAHSSVLHGKQAKGQDCSELLGMLQESQFLFGEEYSSLQEALKEGPGILDLFSGSRGVAKACIREGARWVLCFDISQAEDLLSPKLQDSLISCLYKGFFEAMGASQVCASFSMAVTPPCRNKLYPTGVPWASSKQKLKNEQRNQMLAFVRRAVLVEGSCFGSRTRILLGFCGRWHLSSLGSL